MIVVQGLEAVRVDHRERQRVASGRAMSALVYDLATGLVKIVISPRPYCVNTIRLSSDLRAAYRITPQ
jgi:hypothetical protein